MPPIPPILMNLSSHSLLSCLIRNIFQEYKLFKLAAYFNPNFQKHFQLEDWSTIVHNALCQQYYYSNAQASSGFLMGFPKSIYQKLFWFVRGNMQIQFETTISQKKISAEIHLVDSSRCKQHVNRIFFRVFGASF